MKIELSRFHLWKYGCIFPYMKIEFSRFPVRKYGCIFPYVKLDFLYFLFENKISYISYMKIWMYISIYENLIFCISCLKICVQILGLALLIIFFFWHLETVTEGVAIVLSQDRGGAFPPFQVLSCIYCL